MNKTLQYTQESIEIPYKFLYESDILPQPDLSNTFYYIKSPYDITIDKNDIRVIRTGITLNLPDIIEQRESTNVINVSKYFVQAHIGPYETMSKAGVVQLAPILVPQGQPIDIQLLNQGTKKFVIKRGDIVGCMSLLISPKAKLAPFMIGFTSD